MKKLIPLALCFACALVVAQPARVCEPAVDAAAISPAAKRLHGLLVEKKFGAVQDELDDRLRRYERGDLTDIELYMDIKGAVRAAAVEPLLAQWAAEQPRSFFPRLLKGEHHAWVGYAKRGTATSDSTSVEQFAAMESEFKKALVELQAAREIRPASALPVAGLISIARTVAGAPAVQGLNAEAEKLDPGNMAARYEAIKALSPKWGGTFEALDEAVLRAKAAGLRPARLRYLQYRAEMEKAGFTDGFAKEKVKAIGYYRLAAALCPGSMPWSAISNAAYEIEDWSTVKEATSQVLQLYPRASKDIQRRGWASEKQGNMDEAIKDYQAAADMGDAWSQNKMGYFYMMGTHVKRDISRAKPLLESAAAKGTPGAQANLEWVNKQLGIK